MENITITITNEQMLNLTRALNGYVDYTSNLDDTQKETQKEFIIFAEETYEIFDKLHKKYNKALERLNYKYCLKDPKTNRLIVDQFGNPAHTEETINKKLDAIDELLAQEVEIELPILSNTIFNFLPLEFKILFKDLNRHA